MGRYVFGLGDDAKQDALAQAKKDAEARAAAGGDDESKGISIFAVVGLAIVAYLGIEHFKKKRGAKSAG